MARADSPSTNQPQRWSASRYPPVRAPRAIQPLWAAPAGATCFLLGCAPEPSVSTPGPWPARRTGLRTSSILEEDTARRARECTTSNRDNKQNRDKDHLHEQPLNVGYDVHVHLGSNPRHS